MAISDWPTFERPREKLLSQGVSSLSDAELLAIFLRTGVAGKTAVDLARNLINQYGTLRGIFSASFKDFCLNQGLGPAKYTQLQALLELSRRYFKETMQRGNALTNPSHTKDYLISRLRDQTREIFVCLFLDIRNRVIAYEELFQGTIHSASVYPREVVKRALYHNAAALIVAHNHPSGVAEPSKADQWITQQLVAALRLIEIRLLDHFVIGENEVISFAEMGWL